MAVGISCAGSAIKEALDLLTPMLDDQVDFVRQGALVREKERESVAVYLLSSVVLCCLCFVVYFVVLCCLPASFSFLESLPLPHTLLLSLSS